MLKYLGKIGQDLPTLSEKDWKKIFEFIEYFLVVEDVQYSNKNKTINDNSFNWVKLKEVLDLLGKVK